MRATKLLIQGSDSLGGAGEMGDLQLLYNLCLLEFIERKWVFK